MTRLLLVRHGQSTWNAERRWQGQADPPLSQAGIEQARAAAPTLAALGPFDRVVCSPLQRARLTAELLCARAGLRAPEAVPGLEERDAGAWQGLTHDEIDTRFPGARRGTWRPDDHETDAALRARATAALCGLDGERILAVVHEGVIRALDDDPALLANLAARWLVAGPEGLRLDGPRRALLP